MIRNHALSNTQILKENQRDLSISQVIPVTGAIIPEFQQGESVLVTGIGIRELWRLSPELLLGRGIGSILFKIRDAARSQVAHGVPNLVEIADDHLSGFACGMQKFIIPDIDAHMGRMRSAGGKENEITRLQLVPIDFLALLVLFARGSGQFNIELGEQVFDQTGAVKARLFRASAAPITYPDHLKAGFHQLQARG